MSRPDADIHARINFEMFVERTGCVITENEADTVKWRIRARSASMIVECDEDAESKLRASGIADMEPIEETTDAESDTGDAGGDAEVVG